MHDVINERPLASEKKAKSSKKKVVRWDSLTWRVEVVKKLHYHFTHKVFFKLPAETIEWQKHLEISLLDRNLFDWIHNETLEEGLPKKNPRHTVFIYVFFNVLF